jgi:hypothetical protein
VACTFQKPVLTLWRPDMVQDLFSSIQFYRPTPQTKFALTWDLAHVDTGLGALDPRP